MMVGLYIHVPFCLAKCPYCDFYSVKYSREKAEQYKNAVIRNIKHYQMSDTVFDTVYFGGGTPILLWREICEIIKHIHISDNCEITVEANPSCCTEEALAALRQAGVNRLSLGIQSFDDCELSALGRRHSGDKAEKAVLLAHDCGFKNISADLMLATPGQTEESLKKSLERYCALPVSHISAYMLKIEENTPFANSDLNLPDEDETCELYLHTVKTLTEKGFKQYEISNFARDGMESRHNLKYWHCEEYVGIGPAAHSYLNGRRFYVDRDLQGFIDSPVQREITDEEQAGGFEEYAMLKLRLAEGLSFEECAAFGVDKQVILQRCKKIPDRLISIDKEKVCLTPKGFLLSNQIIAVITGF